MHKLAGHLGKTVGELKQSLSYDELIDWIAYNRLDPIGAYRQDLQTALLAMLQSGDKDSQLSDFVLIDPNPMTKKQRRKLRIEREKAEHHERAKRLMAKFARLQQKTQ